MAKEEKAEKKEYEKITTPAGIAIYPWLSRPQAKYKKPDEFEYKCTLAVDAKLPETVALMKLLNAKAEAAFKEALEKCNPADKKKLDKHVPFELEVGEDEKETGRVLFKVKQSTVIQGKKGPIEITLRFFDAAGNKLEKVPPIYTGSKIKLSCTPVEFYNPAGKVAGVTLRLRAVQIIDLVGGQSAKAEDYGFTPEEGYTSEPGEEEF